MDAFVAHVKATRARGSDMRDIRVILNYLDSKKAFPANVKAAMIIPSTPAHADLLAYMTSRMKVPVNEVDPTLLKLASDIPL